VDGLKKPSYFAFQALEDLGPDLLDAPSATPEHDAGVIPTRASDGSLRLLFWSFRPPGSGPAPAREVELELQGLPPRLKQVALEQYRIDDVHSNIRRSWEALGRPQSLTRSQVATLKSANTLDLADSRDLAVARGRVRYKFKLPVSGVSYVVIR
jgi:xylan 1,4-beta-xylosidase